MTAPNDELFRSGVEHCTLLLDEATRLLQEPDPARELKELAAVARDLSRCLGEVAADVDRLATDIRRHRIEAVVQFVQSRPWPRRELPTAVVDIGQCVRR